MRRHLTAVVLAGALLAAGALAAEAQQNGIVIQNNGVDSTDVAAGADNVRIANNPGAAEGRSGGGVNNETGRAPRERNRDRGERRERNAAASEGAAAPVDAPVDDLQAYAGEPDVAGGAPLAAPQPAEPEPVALQLPNTGTGSDNPAPFPWAAALAALAAGAGGFRARLGRV